MYSVVQELITSKNTLYPHFGTRTIGGIWLLGEGQNSNISEKTYRILWNIIQIATENNLEDLISSNWEFAHQYYRDSLRKIHPEYSNQGDELNKNESQVRNDERKRFYEFYTAFGGLMLYSKSYISIFNMFNYTTSTPPEYELLPDNMNQIFESLVLFHDPYYRSFPFITNKYSFPGLSGLNADKIIKKWICQYIALLFIRQNFININYSFQKPLDFPDIPSSQQEKKNLLNSLEYFEGTVENILKNKELLRVLGYDKITKDWCLQHNKIFPIDFINQLKNKINHEYAKTDIEQPISIEKLEEFKKSTKSILTNTFSSLKFLNNNFEKIEYDEWYYNGKTQLFDKASFANNQEIQNLNYDSFLASQVSNEFHLTISQTAFSKKTSNYLIRSSELFDAVSKVIKEDKSFIILNFGIHIPYYISKYNIKGLKPDSYNSVPIIKMGPYHQDLIGQSLFLLKKSDLPILQFNKLDNDTISKYGLNEYDNTDIIFYENVVDLNKKHELRNELSEKYQKDDLKTSVLACVLLNLSIKWKKNLNITQLKVFSEFNNNGLPDDINKIKPSR